MPTPTEQSFIDKMQAEGWEVHHNGFPDFLCVKDGKVIAVEVKKTSKEQLRQDQLSMMRLLQSLGIESYRWSPNSDLSEDLIYTRPVKEKIVPQIPSLPPEVKTRPEVETRQVIGIFFCRNCHRQFPIFLGSERRRYCADCLPVIAIAAGKRGGRPKKNQIITEAKNG